MNTDEPLKKDQDLTPLDESGDRQAEEHGTSFLVRKEGVGGAVGTAVGGVSGAAAGAVVGAVGGPPGMAIGAVIGAAAGALAGKAAGDAVNPEIEKGEQSPDKPADGGS